MAISQYGRDALAKVLGSQTAAQSVLDHIDEQKIESKSDTNADANEVYYSTTQSALCYKDSSSNVNPIVSTGPAVTAEHAAGVIGTGVAPATYRYEQNGSIITEIKVDLTGLASVATANDVVGLAAGGAAYIGQNVIATNGIIYKIELICLETPAGGDNDVNVVAAASDALEYDGAGGTTYGVNGGDAVAGQVVANLVQGLTANHYFYLTAGTGDTAAAYTAGQFIVRISGHPLLT